MNYLIIGNGGREHAIGLLLKRLETTANLYFIGGNGGTSLIGKNFPIYIDKSLDIVESTKKYFSQIVSVIEKYNIDTVIVGPELPIVYGISDYLQSYFPKLTIIAPNERSAQLEGSKAYAKDFMHRYGIPTAEYGVFTQEQFSDAVDFMRGMQPPYVLKAYGLAAGKGVFIEENIDVAIDVLQKLLSGELVGAAGKKVIIERYLKGREFSVFIFTNGKDYHLLPMAKDYKRLLDNDEGPNTGGMGAFSPVFYAQKIYDKIKKKIIEPTLEGIISEGLIYKGFLYFGLIEVNAEPYVLEYNVRLGDPEAQVILPLIKNGFIDLLQSFNDVSFGNIKLEIADLASLGVVVASGGYPRKYERGLPIAFGNVPEDVLIVHSGTKIENNKFYTDGGRVLTAVSLSDDIKTARDKVYKALKHIDFPNMFYRQDIGREVISE